MFCDGSHFYLDLNSGIGNFYIRDGTTTRFTFDDSGVFTATGDIILGNQLNGNEGGPRVQKIDLLTINDLEVIVFTFVVLHGGDAQPREYD